MPLSGIRVLDLTRLLPGGQCTLILADLGADVVKLEEPVRGDYIRLAASKDQRGVSPLHLTYNRNKRSLALDLKRPEGLKTLLRLVRGADVLVESFRPRVLERLGAGYARLRKENPSLIYCAVTGYGQEGPLAQEPAHDLNLESLGGAVELTGPAQGNPCTPGLPFTDIGTGMWAALAILAALRMVERTGVGQFIDMAMLDTTVGFLSFYGQSFLSCGDLGGRERTLHNGIRPCYRIYPTSDGRHISLGSAEEKFWRNLCRLIGREEFVNDGSARGTRRVEVITALESTFRQRSLDEWLALFEGEEVCVTPVLGLDEVFSHPQVRARRLVYEQPHPAGGSYPTTRIPPGFPIHASRELLPAPALGEHSREVLQEAGFSDQEIESLFAESASRAGPSTMDMTPGD